MTALPSHSGLGFENGEHTHEAERMFELRPTLLG